MTCCVAVKIADKVLIGCESQINMGDQKLYSRDYSKMVVFPNFIVAFAGLSGTYHTLDELARSKKMLKYKIKNVSDAFTFAKLVSKKLKKLVDDSLVENSKIPEIGTDFLIATKKKIFIATDLSAEEYDKFAAIGSGADYAVGSLYQKNNLSRFDIQLAIEAAICYDRSCGGEIRIREC